MADKIALQKFQERRFGVFIHWGLYSTLGGRYQGKTMEYIGEWIQSYFRIPNAEYAMLAASFNPQAFNADEWIQLIKAAGAKYIVYTAKHHDGFAMYHSKADAFNIVDATPFDRDPLKELAQACEKHGIGLGIYYSQNLDWKDPDGRDPGPDFPKNCWTMSWGNDWDYPDYEQKDFERYFRQKCIPQMTELLSNYGPVCELWFDCSAKQEYRYSDELRSLVHRLQPECVINSRIGNDCGDFKSLGDNQHMHGKSTEPIESPITLNDTWGFKHDDHNWKPAGHIVERMASLADRNANLLLNIGPMGNGAIPPASVEILQKIAEWNKQNPGVICGTQPNPFPMAFPWGFCTASGAKLNLFIRDWSPQIEIRGISGIIRSSTVPYEQSEGTLSLLLGKRPNSLLPVVTVEFAEAPDVEQSLILQDDVLELSAYAGKLHHGTAHAQVESLMKVDVAAEICKSEEHMTLSADGTLSNWHNSSDWIEWSILIKQPGRYHIDVVTHQTWHGFNWVGGHMVELLENDGAQMLSNKLECPVEIPTPCYATGAVRIGTLEFRESAATKIRFRCKKVEQAEGALSMNFNSLLMTRNRDGQLDTVTGHKSGN